MLSVEQFLRSGLAPSSFMSKAFDIPPDSWQADLLDKKPKKSLLLCSRQAGKSTVSAAMALHRAVFNDESLVLIISKAYRQAEELFRKVKQGINSISDYIEIKRENQSSLELASGSRIISLPGKEDTIRSYSSVSLLIIDEAAQVSDELYATVRPMLAVSNGSIIGLTTPYGKRGWFYKAWSSDNDWYKIRVPADECSRITDEFLENERKEIGDWWVKQEYMCEFVNNESQFFEYDEVMRAISDDIPCLSLL